MITMLSSTLLLDQVPYFQETCNGKYANLKWVCLRAGGLLVKFPPTVDVMTRMRNTKEP